jgi:hypothetical protein
LEASDEDRWERRQQDQTDDERADRAVAEQGGFGVDGCAHEWGAGSVSVHAPTMLPQTPQRTADNRLAAPEPMIEPEVTCVVDSGYPALEAARMAVASAAGAAKPWATSISMILVPAVLMIRHPPTNVPSAIAVAEAMTTQSGTQKGFVEGSP